MNEKQPAVSLALTLGLFLASTVATAVPIFSIDDLTDTISVSINNEWDSFAVVVGPVEGPAVVFAGTFTDNGPVTTFTTPETFYITEGLRRAGQPISDLLIISSLTRTPGTDFGYTVAGSFLSDLDPGNLGVIPALTPLSSISKEDGTFNPVFNPDRPNGAPGDIVRIRVRSDSIPEPASLALLGIGLAGLAASRRRKST